MEKNCDIFVFENPCFVNILDFIWAWILNFWTFWTMVGLEVSFENSGPWFGSQIMTVRSSLTSQIMTVRSSLTLSAQCRIRAFVEFALHPQHETSRDSEIQTKEDFKCKSRKRLRRLLMVSGNSSDWCGYWNTKSRITEWIGIPREWSWNKATSKNFPSTRTLKCVFI